MSVKYTGLNELKIGLKKRTDLTAVAKLVKSSGASMQENAQKFAPVRTGALRRDIHLNYFDNGMTTKVSSDISYAPYQEFGTRFMAGTPHVRPAFNIQKSIFISELEKLMK
ncbi:HK97-gp10 family putative phage morphogenesis protein [Fructilactobacillus sp. Tb1]|uniref:HK97-gp10 family putative phage morphogenesis protein n=1 Tax=Fructilactobacillus sp. Tb1 TaxID=3422304 RepID=UPI003D2A658D